MEVKTWDTGSCHVVFWLIGRNWSFIEIYFPKNDFISGRYLSFRIFVVLENYFIRVRYWGSHWWWFPLFDNQPKSQYLFRTIKRTALNWDLFNQESTQEGSNFLGPSLLPRCWESTLTHRQARIIGAQQVKGFEGFTCSKEYFLKNFGKRGHWSHLIQISGLGSGDYSMNCNFCYNGS